MNKEQRAELRKAAEEAKLGPWKIVAMESGMVAIDSFHDLQVTGFIDTEDAEFLLAANPATILQLLDYVESLERDAAQTHLLVMSVEEAIQNGCCPFGVEEAYAAMGESK